MNRLDDPFDTHLLRVLCTLLTECSVSRTAIKLNQSQPAISVALKRLRTAFKDPLLVREKGGMVPTERALGLLPSARAALEDIDRLLIEQRPFDPATTRQTFKIGSPDYLVVSFLTSVVETFRQSAPLAQLAMHSLGPDLDYERALAEGRLDIVIGNWPQPPEQLHLSHLLEDELVCVMGRNNPLAKKKLTVEEYLQAPHLVPLPYSPSRRGVVDTHLSSMRVTRNTRVVLPQFTMAPHLLPGTDLIFTTTRHFAMHYARVLPLAIVPSPIEFPRVLFYQLWHDRTHHSAGHRWLRGLLSAAGDKIWKGKRP